MIFIKKTKNADSRCAVGKTKKVELLEDTILHIKAVSSVLNWIGEVLGRMGHNHDWTKLTYLNEFYSDFSAKQDGDPTDFRQMHWYKDIHIVKESHHLDVNPHDDITLFDLMERAADVVTAGMARNGIVFEDNLPPELLVKAYKNTIELLKREIIAED